MEAPLPPPGLSYGWYLKWYETNVGAAPREVMSRAYKEYQDRYRDRDAERAQLAARRAQHSRIRRLLSTKRDIGVVFCHGRAHDPPELHGLEDLDLEWVYLDRDEMAKPDAVVDLTYPVDLDSDLLGVASYVLTQYCLLTSFGQVTDMMCTAMSLLKPGGQLYYDTLLYVVSMEHAKVALGRNWVSGKGVNTRALDRGYRAGDARSVETMHRYLEFLRFHCRFSSYEVSEDPESGLVIFTR